MEHCESLRKLTFPVLAPWAAAFFEEAHVNNRPILIRLRGNVSACATYSFADRSASGLMAAWASRTEHASGSTSSTRHQNTGDAATHQRALPR